MEIERQREREEEEEEEGGSEGERVADNDIETYTCSPFNNGNVYVYRVELNQRRGKGERTRGERREMYEGVKRRGVGAGG